MPIRVQDERRQPFHVVDKLVTWYWLPFIGQTGYTLYNLYISLVNYQTKGAYPSIRKVAQFLDVSENTVRKYNRLLVKYGLIRIEQRHDEETGGQKSHMYYILDPPLLPEEIQEEYNKRKLVHSDFMETRNALVQQQEQLKDSEEGIDDPPLQSLKRGLQSMNPGVQTVKRAPAIAEEDPLQSLKPKEKNKKDKNVNYNNNSPHTVVDDYKNHQQLYDTLRDLGVHHRTADALVNNHPPKQIAVVLNYLAKRLEQGWQPKESAAAWLVAAIREGYELPEAPDATVRQQKAEQSTKLAAEIEQERQEQTEFFYKQREARLEELGISPAVDDVWQQVQKVLREQESWSPALHLAFLAEVSEERATIVCDQRVVHQRLSQKERLQTIKQALHEVLGVWVSVEVALVGS